MLTLQQLAQDMEANISVPTERILESLPTEEKNQKKVEAMSSLQEELANIMERQHKMLELAETKVESIRAAENT